MNHRLWDQEKPKKLAGSFFSRKEGRYHLSTLVVALWENANLGVVLSGIIRTSGLERGLPGSSAGKESPEMQETLV